MSNKPPLVKFYDDMLLGVNIESADWSLRLCWGTENKNLALLPSGWKSSILFYFLKKYFGAFFLNTILDKILQAVTCKYFFGK